jgi:hypothetical protein
VDETVGAMIMDPGTTTGLGWGTFKLERGSSSYEIVAKGLARSMEIGLETELETAEAVAQQFLECRFNWTVERQIPLERVFFVYEDFVLRLPAKSSAREGLSPPRITGMVMGLLHGYDPIYVPQQPGLAMQVTNDQLRRHGLWVVGSEHARDVNRHAITWVRKALK